PREMWHHEPSDWAANALPAHHPAQRGGNEKLIDAPDEGKAVVRKLQESLHLDSVHYLLASPQEAPQFGQDLLEIARGRLRRAKAGAFDVIDLVLFRQPPGDMVAGRPIVGRPVVAEVENRRLLRLHFHVHLQHVGKQSMALYTTLLTTCSTQRNRVS